MKFQGNIVGIFPQSSHGSNVITVRVQRDPPKTDHMLQLFFVIFRINVHNFLKHDNPPSSTPPPPVVLTAFIPTNSSTAL